MTQTKSVTQSRRPLYIVSVGLLVIASIALLQVMPNATVVINEVAHNQDDGRDWVELYNQSNHNITLEGLYLSDDPDDLTRFKFDSTFIVPAGGFAVIYGDRDSSDSLDPSTNFNISAGETIYLMADDGETILDSIYIPDSEADVSETYGRTPDGSDYLERLSRATPSEPNPRRSEM